MCQKRQKTKEKDRVKERDKKLMGWTLLNSFTGLYFPRVYSEPQQQQQQQQHQQRETGRLETMRYQ